MEKEDFPASRDEVLEELLTIETITNMSYNSVEGKKKSDLTPSVNATAIQEPDSKTVVRAFKEKMENSTFFSFRRTENFLE
jgi:hypothetical protein